MTGAAGRYVVTENPFLLDDSCSYREAWNSHVCGGRYGTLEVGTVGGEPADVKPVRLTRGDGAVQTLMGCCADSISAESSVLTDRSYAVGFNGGTPTRTRFVLSRIQEASVTLEVPYPVEPKVTRWGCDLSGGGWCGDGRRGSREDLANYNDSGYYYDPAAQTLYLKIHNESGNEYNELRVEPRGP